MKTRTFAAFALWLMALSCALPGIAQQISSEPLLPRDAVQPFTPHVWLLKGWPNIGFVVGERGILVVDTGMGARNGTLVGSEAAKLATRGQKLYLATTHYHPEHAGGVQGFPAGTMVLRSRVQQAEADVEGPRMIDFFRSLSPTFRDLLQGTAIGTANQLFDAEYALDLGGVHVRLIAAGPAHTRGDTVILVVEDSVLFTGDIVQRRIAPNMGCEQCTPRSWIAALDRLAPLSPAHIVPTHSDVGDATLIVQARDYLVDLQQQAAVEKGKGRSAEQAGADIAARFAQKYAGWGNLRYVPDTVRKAYRDLTD